MAPVLTQSLRNNQALKDAKRARQLTLEEGKPLDLDLANTKTAKGISWAEELRRSRDRRGLTPFQLSRRVRGANAKMVEAWERGESIPTPVQVVQLESILPSLGRLHSALIEAKNAEKKAAEEKAAAEAEAAEKAAAEAPWIEPAPVTVPVQACNLDGNRAAMPRVTPAQREEFRIFGEKLKFYRGKAGMKKATLGKMLGVTGGAVANWEAGLSSPIDEIRVRLIEFCPPLAEFMPSYSSRIKHKPVRKAEMEALANAVATPAPVAAPADELDALNVRYLAAVRALQRARAEQGAVRAENEAKLAELTARDEAATQAVTEAAQALSEIQAAMHLAAGI